jgi:hypothetical protein
MAFSRSGAWGVCRDRVRTPGTAARSSRVGTQAHCHGTPLQDKRGRDLTTPDPSTHAILLATLEGWCTREVAPRWQVPFAVLIWTSRDGRRDDCRRVLALCQPASPASHSRRAPLAEPHRHWRSRLAANPNDFCPQARRGGVFQVGRRRGHSAQHCSRCTRHWSVAPRNKQRLSGSFRQPRAAGAGVCRRHPCGR